MKRFLVLLLATILFSGVKAQDEVKLETLKDSLSYAVGVSMYGGAQKLQIDIDYDLLMKAFMEAKEGKAMIREEDANMFISGSMRNMEKRNFQVNLENGRKFLEENKKVEGVIETESGLQYRVINMGDGLKPTIEDRVRVHYTGYLLDGTKFDSSLDRGKPSEFGLTSVIKGWTEVLQLMPVGSEFVVYIPADLAYGNRKAGELILPGSTLMFEIQLLGIVE